MDKMFGMDRYDRNARLHPALLTLLPAFLFVFVWFPDVWTLFGAIVAFVVICGTLFALTRFTRKVGRKVETTLSARIGRLHTASLLSLSDDRLSTSMKTACRSYIKANSGRALPTLEQEQNDPKSAQDDLLLAVRWLLEHTRPQAEASLLLNENISYGFARNLLGLKPYGILITAGVSVGSAWFLKDTASGTTPFVLGSILLGASVVGLVLWMTAVTKASVEEASQVYAEKILSLCLDANQRAT